MIHTFDTDHASQYGVVEAVIIANFQFWIAKNKANDTHQHDGRTWTYNSNKAFEQLFPYLTGNQIRRALDGLIAAGILVAGNYNQSGCDRTKWFAFSDESIFVFPQKQLAKNPNAIGKKPKTLTNTDTKPDRKPDTQLDAVFEEAWNAYPKRSGGNSKKAALKAWNARIAAGVAPADMLAGTILYAAFCVATDKIDTPYVKQAATFYGPDLHFSEPWTAPAGKPGAGSDRMRTSYDRTADIALAAKTNAARGVPELTDDSDLSFL